MWEKTQSDERLLGVSVTGWQDAFSLLGWETNSPESIELMTWMNRIANEEATLISSKLDIPRPLLVTCLKPEGSASQVLGASSGLHWPWSKYYLRRVRMTAIDPLALTLVDSGYTCTPELYDLNNYSHHYGSELGVSEDLWSGLNTWDKLDLYYRLSRESQLELIRQANTVVFEFPIKSAGRSLEDVSTLEQLESMKNFSNHYVDHMASCTISVKDNDWDSIVDWLVDNWEGFTTTSFLPYDNTQYPLLPYELIEEEEYLEKFNSLRDKGLVSFTTSDNYHYVVDEKLLEKYEVGRDVEILEESCSTGSCPVR